MSELPHPFAVPAGGGGRTEEKFYRSQMSRGSRFTHHCATNDSVRAMFAPPVEDGVLVAGPRLSRYCHGHGPSGCHGGGPKTRGFLRACRPSRLLGLHGLQTHH